jgi:hypothetical protein
MLARAVPRNERKEGASAADSAAAVMWQKTRGDASAVSKGFACSEGWQRVEKMWTLGQQREAPANDARRWFIVHQSVSTTISTTTYFGVHW